MNHHSQPAKSGTFGPPPRLFRQPLLVRRALEGAALFGIALLLPLLADWDSARSPVLLVGSALIAATIFVPAVLLRPWLLATLTGAGCLLIGLTIPNTSSYTGPMHLVLHAVLARNAPFFSWPMAIASAVALESLYLGVRSDFSLIRMAAALTNPVTTTDTAAKLTLVALAKGWYDMNQTVRKSALELAAVTGSSSHLIGLLDRNGIVRSVNGACRQVLGIEPEEITGRCVTAVLGPIRAPSDANLGRLIDAGQPVYNLLIQVPGKGGSPVWLEWNLEPIPELDAILCVGRDVSQREGR